MILNDEKINNFINSIYQTHLDNIKSVYKVSPSGNKPIMPLTNFIFEFFIFNSLYQINWSDTITKSNITYHNRESETENNQIAKFLKFIRQNNNYRDNLLVDCFEPFKYLNIEGEWTKIVEDNRIKIEDGENFFKNLEFIKRGINESKLPPSKNNFKLIKSCLYFIGIVRNSIFHGSKTQQQAGEESQSRRIEVYDIFTKCVNALFFAIFFKISKQISTHKIQIPIDCLKIESKIILMSVNKGHMKIEDSRIINLLDTINFKPNLGDSLFYPSAAYDIITPTIISLKHINHFYFYNESYDFRKLSKIKHDLKKMLNLEIDYDRHKGSFSFVFNDRKKTLYFIDNDNKTFLKKNINLGFYFHRGDGIGEGGSNQKWDSDLLPELRKKIKPSHKCFFFSDGVPGGFSDDLKILNKIKLKKTERGRDYCMGYLK